MQTSVIGLSSSLLEVVNEEEDWRSKSMVVISPRENSMADLLQNEELKDDLKE